MRRRPRPEPDAEAAAALDEARTIETLAGYQLRAYAPATWCEFKPETGWPEFDAESICARYPDHPAVVAYLNDIGSAAEIREDAEQR